MNRKRFIIIASVCAVVVLAGIIWWGYKQLSLHEEKADIDLYTLVPAESQAVLETQDIQALLKSIRYANFNREYESLHISELLDYLSDGLESISSQQAHGLSGEMSQLLVSFHAPGMAQDQVIYGRLNDNEKNFIQGLLTQQAETAKLPSPKTFIYKGEEILIYPIGKTFMACYFVPGCFAISLQEKLIEKVIDAYKEGSSISHDKGFQPLRQQRKHHDPLTLYLYNEGEPMQGWTEFDIRMNAESIYLTSGHAVQDTCSIFGSSLQTQQPIGQLTDTELPGNLQMVYQLPFNPHPKQEEGTSITETLPDNSLESMLETYACHEIDILVFSPQERQDICHQLLLVPLTESATDAIRQSLRYHESAVRKPGMWMLGMHYPIWLYNGKGSLHNYFNDEPEEKAYFLTFHKNKMLVATDTEALKEYLTEVNTHEKKKVIDNRILYEYCMNDLAEQANFTLIADMNGIMDRTGDNQQIVTQLLPEFFFKHKDFFKNFMFSTQYIYTNGQISTNLILTYQGDSVLWKKMEEN